MPANLQVFVLLLLFIVPGFVFVEVDLRRRPAQQLGTFDKTVLSILFSTIVHSLVLWPIVLCSLGVEVDAGKVFDKGWLVDWTGKHLALTYTYVFFYFLFCIVVAVLCGFKVGSVTRRWMPVLSRIVRRDRDNWVLVQMKNGDFFTGALDMIPADYDILQGPAKDFTIVPPGRYKPKGQSWQDLQKHEVILLNTSNVDAISWTAPLWAMLARLMCLGACSYVKPIGCDCGMR